MRSRRLRGPSWSTSTRRATSSSGSGLLLCGAALLLAGQLLTPPGALSALLVSIGAVLGGLPLFWTLLVPVAVAAVIACSIALARRDAAPA